MTDRIYYRDAYLREFDARVTERADDGRRLYLDRSAFYPTSGGQSHDGGTLNGISVTDVVDEGERVAHVLAGPVMSDAVHGEVDWGRRFDHMQQHSGQHLLSALFAQRGCETVSVHFGSVASTLDLACDGLDHDVLRDVEERANELVLEGRPITIAFEDPATVVGLRKLPERSGGLRVVTIEGVDRSACGGTHVRSTAEIGAVLVRGRERVHRTTRVGFVCGRRALHRARLDHEALAQVAQALGSSPDSAPEWALVQSEQLRAAERLARRLQEELDELQAAELYRGASPQTGGVRRVVQRQEARPLASWRGIAQAFSRMERAVFIATSAAPPSLLVACSQDSGMDASALLRSVLHEAGGKGGGSARLAQGSLPSAEAVETALRLLQGA